MFAVSFGNTASISVDDSGVSGPPARPCRIRKSRAEAEPPPMRHDPGHAGRRFSLHWSRSVRRHATARSPSLTGLGNFCWAISR